VPGGLKGEFVAKVKYDMSPCEVKAEEVRFTVK
jgi:hypothetical protein